MTYTDSYGPDPDGDPVQSRNGGEVVAMTVVLRDDSNGAVPSADTPSCGSGSTVPAGPCA